MPITAEEYQFQDFKFDEVKNKQDVYKFQAESFKRHQSELTRLIHSYHPKATIYFNGCTTLKRGSQNFKHKMYEYNTVSVSVSDFQLLNFKSFLILYCGPRIDY